MRVTVFGVILLCVLLYVGLDEFGADARGGAGGGGLPTRPAVGEVLWKDPAPSDLLIEELLELEDETVFTDAGYEVTRLKVRAERPGIFTLHLRERRQARSQSTEAIVPSSSSELGGAARTLRIESGRVGETLTFLVVQERGPTSVRFRILEGVEASGPPEVIVGRLKRMSERSPLFSTRDGQVSSFLTVRSARPEDAALFVRSGTTDQMATEFFHGKALTITEAFARLQGNVPAFIAGDSDLVLGPEVPIDIVFLECAWSPISQR